jgi:hypothetical protein
VGSLFGDGPKTNVVDLAVYTNLSKQNTFFAHVLYWDTKHGRDAPHILALRDAIDLADTGVTNAL